MITSLQRRARTPGDAQEFRKLPLLLVGAAAIWEARVRCGSKTELSPLALHVRSTLKSRHRQAAQACPFRANGLNRSRGSALWRTAGPTRVSICSSGPKMQHDDIRTAKDSNDEIHTI